MTTSNKISIYEWLHQQTGFIRMSNVSNLSKILNGTLKQQPIASLGEDQCRNVYHQTGFVHVSALIDLAGYYNGMPPVINLSEKKMSDDEAKEIQGQRMCDDLGVVRFGNWVSTGDLSYKYPEVYQYVTGHYLNDKDVKYLHYNEEMEKFKKNMNELNKKKLGM